MRSAFLTFLISFIPFSYGETLSNEALKACASHLVAETSKLPSEFTDWSLLPEDLSQDLEATVLVRLDASLVSSTLMQTNFRYDGIVSPGELTRVDARHRAVFFVVHGSRQNLTRLAQDLKQKFPSRSLSYRILLSRPVPFENSPPFIRANGLSLTLAEAIENCFFTACAVNDEPSEVTAVTKEVRDNMITFLRDHASSEEMAKINIGTDFGLLRLIKDFMAQTSDDTKAKIDKALAPTEPKKSDGTGFRANNPKAVQRVLDAWIVMVKSLDESLLADPFSDKTLAALDRIHKEKMASRPTKGKRKAL